MTNKINLPKSKFRPCIDLHQGKVKQIIGGTLTNNENTVKTNFVSNKSSSYYAELYQKHNLTGGHLIKLGPGNDEAAREALKQWPGGLQVGGGITIENAQEWIDLGATKVIVTSWLFTNNEFDIEKLKKLSSKIGKEHLVVDIRKYDGGWYVAMNKWQTKTNLQVTEETVSMLSNYCSEFLIHAADVEGLCEGIDEELVKCKCLGEWVNIPTTYAGGASSIGDLSKVNDLSFGKVDLTIGSALDIFGGDKVKFEDCVAWNNS
ncbi:hypothetical protein BB558_002444 [Smittium angustum]|uniref:1-(5-phosphoribosyl)-5-[(5-phosphoribosylamino)methylideneamino] imidazole-4-carboxamide isomerase n=1 Tax=Smittium angustum TaxID=133377 RepID=A0A2U1J8R3_SMIAN|nr:hypothetical protein BB558_002444 [Smittium angustum]